MDYNYLEEDKSQRIRAIIITIAFSVIVLGIAAWAIIAIVSSRSGNEEIAKVDDPVAAVEENKSATVEEKADEGTAPATEGVAKTSTSNSTNKSNTTARAAATVPETGPEDFLPLAMLLGTGTTFVFSRKMSKA